MNFRHPLFFLVFCTLFLTNGKGQTDANKHLLYLSGTDATHTKTWNFYCTGGRKSGAWNTIQVPSHWEQQGFGAYNYGRDNVTYGRNFRYADEKGMYKYAFTVPAGWKGREVSIVFEGSMTDTEVKINGQAAGPVHQGAFYRFAYNIGSKLKYGQPNLLEVTVSKMSADKTVNGAERFSDYWIFGGIFRPVYLQALPRENIGWTTIDAKADGSFKMNVHLNNAIAGRTITAQIKNARGMVVATASSKVSESDTVVQLQTTVLNPLQWTAETPNRYNVVVSLKNGKSILYQTTEKFGFRTLEVRRGDGIYLNGVKIKIKGVNRHVFWPEYGRATYPEADLLDVKLIKEMNMNAVRCSHYPPDENFLRVCDSLGLYVVDELAGWQHAYSTAAGTPLVKEMVQRDANHPSIILWSNGNEGGHNKTLDDDFGQYDLSNRTVIHAHHKPGNAINGIDCNHYEDYYSTEKIVADTNIYMPTEFLHAMNDGGGGAALADFWELHWNSKKGAGGFLWNYADEGIMRTDQHNMLDVDGYNAADGVVGPHREKEGSFFAIKQIYSSVHITLKDLPVDFRGGVSVENRYHFTNLKDCSFRWELMDYSSNKAGDTGYTIAQKGSIPAPDIAPTAKGVLQLSLPQNWRNNDALALTAYDPTGNELYRWVWKIKTNVQLLQSMMAEKSTGTASTSETDTTITLKASGISVCLSKKTGLLTGLANDYSAKLSFCNGPVLVSGQAVFTGLKHFKEGDNQVVEATYTGNLSSVRWTMQPNGWLEMKYEYNLNGKYPFAGISFSYPENAVLGAKWLGNGPNRVWKNRLQGVTPNIYHSRNNTTHTGRSPWMYPEFKGYFADVVWMELSTLEGRFTVASPDKDLFVRLFDFYGISGPKPTPELPVGDISFLDAIPPIGSKLGISTSSINGLGPASQLNSMEGPVKRTLYFYFGLPGKPNEGPADPVD